MAKLTGDPETVAMTKIIAAVGKLEAQVAEAFAGLPPDASARLRAWLTSRFPAIPVPPAKEQA